MTPEGIGTAIAAIWSSGAKGTDALVLVCLAHSLDWRSMDGETGIPSLEIANRIGMARSVVVESLGRLEASGVVAVAPFVNGRPKARSIQWDKLAAYTSPETKRGGVRTPDPSEHRTRPNIGQVPVRTSDRTRPNIGQDPSEHRTLILPSPPKVLPESSLDAPVPVAPSIEPATEKPAKVKRTKPDPEQPSDSERQAFDDALGAIAEIDQGAALRIEAGTSGALRKSLLSAIRRDGDVLTVRRLRYVARSGDGLDLCTRKDGPGLGPLLYDPKRPNPRTGGPCWAAQLDDKAAAMVATPGGSRTLAHDTDSRWRDPGWSPTRRVEPPRTDPRKPAESITERALTVHELARQMQENRHAKPRDHRHDDRDLLALEGGGAQAPGGVARRTG